MAPQRRSAENSTKRWDRRNKLNSTKSKRSSSSPPVKVVPRKGWPYKQFSTGLYGFLTTNDTFYKRLTVKHPPENPTFYLFEIRKYYRNKNKRSDEGVYLTEKEYANLIDTLGHKDFENKVFEFKSEDEKRKITISPNSHNGGIKISQTVKRVAVDEGTGEEKTVEIVRRDMNLTRTEIIVLLSKYSLPHYFIVDHYLSNLQDNDSDRETDDDENKESDKECKDTDSGTEPDLFSLSIN